MKATDIVKGKTYMVRVGTKNLPLKVTDIKELVEKDDDGKVKRIVYTYQALDPISTRVYTVRSPSYFLEEVERKAKVGDLVTVFKGKHKDALNSTTPYLVKEIKGRIATISGGRKTHRVQVDSLRVVGDEQRPDPTMTTQSVPSVRPSPAVVETPSSTKTKRKGSVRSTVTDTLPDASTAKPSSTLSVSEIENSRDLDLLASTASRLDGPGDGPEYDLQVAAQERLYEIATRDHGLDEGEVEAAQSWVDVVRMIHGTPERSGGTTRLVREGPTDPAQRQQCLTHQALVRESTQPSPQRTSLGARLAAESGGSKDNSPHLIVEARAGTGKTTTLVEGLKLLLGLEPSITPTPQQRAVWDAIALSKGKAQSICFVAFNKALREDQLVLSEDGWVPIGELDVGEQVYGPDGALHGVTKVHRLGIRPMLRVIFSDGTEVVADPEHLWTTETVAYQRGDGEGWTKGSRWKTRTTQEIYESLDAMHRVPLTSSIQCPEKEFPLDPYLLGALVGDGSFVHRSVLFTTADDEMVEFVKGALPRGHVLLRADQKYGYRIVNATTSLVGGGKGWNVVLNGLKALGLHGLRSWEKFIPERYLFGSISQRLDLLRGLMDTDGCANGVTSQYSTTSLRLAMDVQYLCQSLGGICSIRTIQPPTESDRVSYWINVRIDRNLCPFRLTRKVEKWRERKNDSQTYRKIVDIVEERAAEAVCISIDSPDHLFLTHGLIPTHNSIAEELQKRVPAGVCASTMHSMGFAAVRNSFGRGVKVESYRVSNILSELYERDVRELRKDKFEVMKGIEDLVAMCKMNLTGQDPGHPIELLEQDLDNLVSHYEIEIPLSYVEEVYAMVPRVLNRCRDVRADMEIDYNDMIWLPVALDLKVTKYDMLLVDEAQDLNRCQQALAKKAGHRLILCGDRYQCHPAGTLVDMTGGKRLPIEEVKVGDQLVTFNPNAGRISGGKAQGRKVEQVASRNYSGPLYSVNATKCTPNHRWLTRLRDEARSLLALYLMELRDGSFRIGLTQLLYSDGNGFGPGLRARQEGGVKVWVLDTFRDRREAREQEFKNSLRYRIPQRAQYDESDDSWPRELIEEGYPPDIDGLLTRYSRSYEFPIWEGTGEHIGRYSFVTEACNLLPDACLIATRADTADSGIEWASLDLDIISDWSGTVYSLKVQPTERGLRLYIADGNVTHNSIYGFAGADSDSLPRMYRELTEDVMNRNPADPEVFAKFRNEGACIKLPLTVTRRCGKAIVEEAKKLVPDFEAFETNCEGKVSNAKYPDSKSKILTEEEKKLNPDYTSRVEDGDFILCRVNAPLVSQCFRFLKIGRKATIQGRDIGKGLVKLMQSFKASTVNDLVKGLSDWLYKETQKENQKRNPSEAKLINLGDKHDCLMAFTEGANTVDDVVRKIESVFVDNKDVPGIKLSSIHRAKGLEAKRVFFLQPEGGQCPHPMARSAWQKEQEHNLYYVAVTRAIEELIIVK